jgi:hypothetical protein
VVEVRAGWPSASPAAAAPLRPISSALLEKADLSELPALGPRTGVEP